MPKVSAAATNGPKQIVIFFSAGCHESAIGKHNIGFQQVIKSQTIFPCQIARPSTESESSDSGG